jgi:hypothetical protein
MPVTGYLDLQSASAQLLAAGDDEVTDASHAPLAVVSSRFTRLSIHPNVVLTASGNIAAA